jgi:hypothetical protein
LGTATVAPAGSAFTAVTFLEYRPSGSRWTGATKAS